jgi:hypothetical protein
LHDFEITKLSGSREALTAQCREISVHLEWRQLLHRVLIGRISIESPIVSIRGDGAGPSAKREGSSSDAVLKLCRETQDLMPFYLRSLEVQNGRVEYNSPSSSPPYHLAVEKLSLFAANLTNMQFRSESPAGHVFVEGKTTGNGSLWLRLNMPAPTEALNFQLQAGLDRVNLVDLNDFLRAHAKFEVTRGTCSIYSEFQVENGAYQGYVQPHFKNLDVFAWQKEHGKGFLHICRQAIIAFVAYLFHNHSRDELAATIPVKGTFADADVDIWSAIGSLLQNAFVHSLLPGDGSSRETASKPGRGMRFWKGWKGAPAAGRP